MDQANKLLDKYIKNANVSIEYLNDASSALSQVDDAIASAKESISDARRSEDAAAYFDSTLETVKEDASNILINVIDAAVTRAPEYKHPKFLAALYEVANNDSLYEFTKTGSGWKSSISVKLRMNDVAGDISEYGQAVNAAREKLKVKDSRDPIKASKYWRNKVYGTELLDKTITLRLESAQSPAPFWSLLDSGNKEVFMESNIGGRRYPSTRPTRFVNVASKQIKRHFTTLFREARAQYYLEVGKIESAINEGIKKSNLLSRIVDKISRQFDKVDTTLDELNVKNKEIVDYSKVLSAMVKAKRGETLPGRISIGKRGTRKTLSSRKLLGVL